MSSADHFPLVDVSGDPHARGFQHGRAVPERIARGIDLYRAQLQRRGLSQETTYELARAMLPIIKAYDAGYLEELGGIALGAEVTLEDIVMINCRTEMLFGYEQLAQRTPTAVAPSEDGDCTGLVVLPARSANGRLIHAHNWDWREECVDTGIVLRIRREDGPDILTFTEAGALARHGFNAHGVSLTGNSLVCHEDFTMGEGVPLVLLRRRVLEATNLAQAMKSIWNSRRYCANNMIVAQAVNGDGSAISLETAPSEIFWTEPEDDLLVHANHWMSPTARIKLKDPSLCMRPDTIYRQHRVETGLAKVAGRIGIEHIKAVLADEFGTPDGVLRTPKPGDFSSISATVATTVMDAEHKKMWVARKPYAGQTFVEYAL